MKIRIEDAAALADASYDVSRLTSPRIDLSCPHPDVQAYVLSTGVLLLPGSNSLRDYLRYNLRLLNLGSKRLKLVDTSHDKGASGTLWHQGFLAYSKVIYDWLGANNVAPEAIIGHSLGAAATQILSKSYAVTGIGFAAPRPKYARGNVQNAKHCLIANRSDDRVPSLPPRFHHMSAPRVLEPKQAQTLFISHKMSSYRDEIGRAQDKGVLPVSWP